MGRWVSSGDGWRRCCGNTEYRERPELVQILHLFHHNENSKKKNNRLPEARSLPSHKSNSTPGFYTQPIPEARLGGSVSLRQRMWVRNRTGHTGRHRGSNEEEWGGIEKVLGVPHSWETIVTANGSGIKAAEGSGPYHPWPDGSAHPGSFPPPCQCPEIKTQPSPNILLPTSLIPRSKETFCSSCKTETKRQLDTISSAFPGGWGPPLKETAWRNTLTKAWYRHSVPRIQWFMQNMSQVRQLKEADRKYPQHNTLEGREHKNGDWYKQIQLHSSLAKAALTWALTAEHSTWT